MALILSLTPQSVGVRVRDLGSEESKASNLFSELRGYGGEVDLLPKLLLS